MITTTAFFDLSREDRENDRRVLGSLYAVEPGTHVILFVGNREHPMGDIGHVREYIPTLHLDVHGAPSAYQAWVDALMGRGIWGCVTTAWQEHEPPPFGDTLVPFRRSWQPVNLTDVLAGNWQPIEPTVGTRADGAGLFYPGKVHTVSSESEGGKTWLALSAVLDEIRRDNHVLYVDFEDDEGGIVGRLLTLGAQRDDLSERFHYLRPEDALGTGLHLDDLIDVLRTHRPSLAVLDGVTEALTMHGLDPNNNSDVAAFGRMLPRRLAAEGAASVSLDHVAKSTENRGRYSIGAVHKLNGLDGAAYVLENRKPFGVGITGRSTLRIAKDRPGQLRRTALPSSSGMFWAGDLVLVSHAEGFSEVSVESPHEADGTFRPTVYMGRIMDAIEEHGPLSKRMLRTAAKGKAQTIDAALDQLILDGFLTETTPHTKLKEWVVDDQA